MIARKQEIGLQLNQLIDALLLGGVFWICHLVSVKGLVGPASPTEVPGFTHFLWMLAVVVPFTPFLLELNGFYNYQLDKSLQGSMSQIIQAGFWLLVVLGSASVLLRLEIPNFSVLMLFGLAAPATLLLKERIYIAHRTMRLRRGETSERIILAGEKDNALKLLQEFSPSQRLEIQVVDIVDLECCGSDTLVNAVHRHNVGRVILTFSRIEPEKVQRAIKACEIEGVEVWLSADFIRTSVARPAFESLGRRPMLVFRSSPELSLASSPQEHDCPRRSGLDRSAPACDHCPRRKAHFPRTSHLLSAKRRNSRKTLHDAQIPHDTHRRGRPPHQLA